MGGDIGEAANGNEISKTKGWDEPIVVQRIYVRESSLEANHTPRRCLLVPSKQHTPFSFPWTLSPTGPC